MTWGRTASSRVTGTRAHRALAAQARERDGYRCVAPDPTSSDGRCPQPVAQVDHVTPVHRGGPDVLENLASLCEGHHRRKTVGEAAAAKPKLKRPPERHPGLL